MDEKITRLSIPAVILLILDLSNDICLMGRMSAISPKVRSSIKESKNGT